MKHPFEGFPKMARLSRECTITEKIDGTNAQIYITDDGEMLVGSRNRWITPQSDNAGFARWCQDNKEILLTLGPGKHFGEWWGAGIQRRYGLTEKRFSLFNSFRWKFLNEVAPDQNPLAGICGVVPVLYEGPFSTEIVEAVLDDLRSNGSHAAPGFMDPEGVVIYHHAAQFYFKKTLNNDALPKTLAHAGIAAQ